MVRMPRLSDITALVAALALPAAALASAPLPQTGGVQAPAPAPSKAPDATPAATAPATTATPTSAPGYIRPPAAVLAFAAPAVRALQARGAWPRPGGDLGAPATRRELARVLAALRPGVALAGPPAVDVPAGDPDARAVARVVRAGWITRRGGGAFEPDGPLTAAVLDAAVVRWLGLAPERRGLQQIADGAGVRLKTPPGFATEVLVREARLRRNYPASQDQYELGMGDTVRRADLADVVFRATSLAAHRKANLSVFRTIQLPVLSDAQRSIVERAFSYVGHPYIWGGESPSTSSPWGGQQHAGFDCSGLVWGVYKLGVPGNEGDGQGTPGGRTADQMAWESPAQNIRLEALQTGDLIFFGPNGMQSPRGSIGHVGIALGNGWMIHSSGSISGPSVTYLKTYWPDGMTWGRRLPQTGAAAPTPAEAAPTTPLPVRPASAVAAPR